MHKVARECDFVCPLWCGAEWGWENAVITLTNMILKSAAQASASKPMEWEWEHVMIKQLEARQIARRRCEEEGRKAAKAEAVG